MFNNTRPSKFENEDNPIKREYLEIMEKEDYVHVVENRICVMNVGSSKPIYSDNFSQCFGLMIFNVTTGDLVFMHVSAGPYNDPLKSSLIETILKMDGEKQAIVIKGPYAIDRLDGVVTTLMAQHQITLEEKEFSFNAQRGDEWNLLYIPNTRCMYIAPKEYREMGTTFVKYFKVENVFPAAKNESASISFQFQDPCTREIRKSCSVPFQDKYNFLENYHNFEQSCSSLFFGAHPDKNKNGFTIDMDQAKKLLDPSYPGFNLNTFIDHYSNYRVCIIHCRSFADANISLAVQFLKDNFNIIEMIYKIDKDAYRERRINDVRRYLLEDIFTHNHQIDRKEVLSLLSAAVDKSCDSEELAEQNNSAEKKSCLFRCNIM